MRHLTIAGLLLIAAALNSDATILYSFSEIPDGVQLTYSGSLDTSELSFQGTLGWGSTIPLSFISFNGASPYTSSLYDFEDFRPSPLLPGYPGPYVEDRYMAVNISFLWNLDTVANYYAPSSTYGDNFGFYIFQRNSSYTTLMYLPYGYTSGAPITGGMLFAGQTLASMGLSPGELFQVFLPGNEMISGTVVPEPRPICLLALTGLGILAPLARRTSQMQRTRR